MPIERRWKLSGAGMAKRSFRRVSGGQDARSERPARWHGPAPMLHQRPTTITAEGLSVTAALGVARYQRASTPMPPWSPIGSGTTRTSMPAKCCSVRLTARELAQARYQPRKIWEG